MREFITNSAEETQKIALNIAKTLKGGEVFVLTGDLGAGKTTFIQGLAEGLGVKNNITSPTFVLMKQYRANNNLQLVHIDCYRIENPNSLEELGLDEIFYDKKNIIVIEWGERIIELLPDNLANINFEYISENRRIIKISNIKFYPSQINN